MHRLLPGSPSAFLTRQNRKLDPGCVGQGSDRYGFYGWGWGQGRGVEVRVRCSDPLFEP